MNPPPLIAVCARTLTFADEGKRDAFSSSQPYSRAVARAGGVPVLVPPIKELYRNAHTVLQHFDGVLLPGGGDVDPRRYGAEPDDDTLYGIVEAHDELDIAICLAAIELDLPMLALCRGMQVLNVALGGTLLVDIPSQRSSGINHRQMDRKTQLVHSVRLTAGSQLAMMTKTCVLGVNSTHHQAVDRVAAALQVVARAPDGMVEAMEQKGKGLLPFLLSVQFHPERLMERHWKHRAIFEAFIRASLAEKTQKL